MFRVLLDPIAEVDQESRRNTDDKNDQDNDCDSAHGPELPSRHRPQPTNRESPSAASIVGGISFRAGMFRKHDREEADASILHVEMLKRINYGTATVRVTYSIQPPVGAAFEVVTEAKVKMATLPQAGQQVRVSYDPEKPDRLEVLTPPGEETGTTIERTKELPYADRRMPRATEGEVQQLRERVEGQQPDALLEKLKQLGALRDSGVLTEDEFESQKARLLAEP
jgi:hypothetical protein